MPEAKTDKKGVITTTDRSSTKADPAAVAEVIKKTGKDPNDVKPVVTSKTPEKTQVVPEPPELRRLPELNPPPVRVKTPPLKNDNKRIIKTGAKISVRKGPRPIADEPQAVEAAPFIQPAEVVVGRYYEVTYKDGRKIVGEMVAEEGSLQSIDPWVEGRPTGDVVTVYFANRDVREISREAAFELSHSHIHPA